MLRMYVCTAILIFSNNVFSAERDGYWLLEKCSPITKYRDLITGELKKDPPIANDEDVSNLAVCLPFIDGIALSHYYAGKQEGNKPQVCAYRVGYSDNEVAIAVMATLMKAVSLKDSEKFYEMPAAVIVTEVMQGNYPCKQTGEITGNEK